jgi:hypothetical protein
MIPKELIDRIRIQTQSEYTVGDLKVVRDLANDKWDLYGLGTTKTFHSLSEVRAFLKRHEINQPFSRIPDPWTVLYGTGRKAKKQTGKTYTCVGHFTNAEGIRKPVFLATDKVKEVL